MLIRPQILQKQLIFPSSNSNNLLIYPIYRRNRRFILKLIFTINIFQIPNQTLTIQGAAACQRRPIQNIQAINRILMQN